MRKSVIFLGVLVAAGCASSSKDISASYVSPMQYSNYTCEQIAIEAARVSTELQTASGEQDKRRSTDAVVTGVGAVLFWPALFFIKGDGAKASEIGKLKGEYTALHQAATQKNCTMASAEAQPVSAQNDN